MKDDEGPKLPTARMLDGVTIWNFPPIGPIGPLFREPNLIDYVSALGVPAHLMEPASPAEQNRQNALAQLTGVERRRLYEGSWEKTDDET